MNNPLLSIIITNKNAMKWLEKCLLSIEAQTFKSFEVVFVDNVSTDGSTEYVEKAFPWVRVVRNKKDLGFAGANNVGVEHAKGQYVFLINTDTELFPDAVEKLIKAYRPKSILTARQIPTRDKNRGVQRTGAGADLFGYPYFNHAHPEKTKIFYADGAAMFFAKHDFELIGGFDEALYMFQEDIDFSWRAQMIGYNILGVTEAKLYHYYGGTATVTINKEDVYTTSYFRRYLNERNVIRNILKNYSLLFIVPILSVLLLIHTVEMSLLLMIGKWKVVRCYLNAYRWNLRNIKNTLDQRRMVQSKRTVSDAQIIRQMYWKYSKFQAFLKVGMPDFK